MAKHSDDVAFRVRVSAWRGALRASRLRVAVLGATDGAKGQNGVLGGVRPT